MQLLPWKIIIFIIREYSLDVFVTESVAQTAIDYGLGNYQESPDVSLLTVDFCPFY